MMDLVRTDGYRRPRLERFGLLVGSGFGKQRSPSIDSLGERASNKGEMTAFDVLATRGSRENMVGRGVWVGVWGCWEGCVCVCVQGKEAVRSLVDDEMEKREMRRGAEARAGRCSSITWRGRGRRRGRTTKR